MKIYYIGFIGTIVICVGTMFYINPFFKNQILKYTDYEHNAAEVASVLESWRFTQAHKSEVPLRHYDRMNAESNNGNSKVNAPHHTARARLATPE